MAYQVIVLNEQGASDAQNCHTLADIGSYLREWSDPENLSIRIWSDGVQLGEWPKGRLQSDADIEALIAEIGAS